MSTLATQKTEVVIIGSGIAGYVCAIRLAQLGKKVVVIDKAEIGGVCLNRGCIPSKALITAGNLFEKMQHANEIGLEGFSQEKARVNMSKLVTWKQSVVTKLTSGVSQLLKANGIQFVVGEARFMSTKTVEVKHGSVTSTIEFQNAVIATGSRPASIKGLETNGKTIIDSTSALDLQNVPKTLLCIGGGYIGLELGTFFAKVGSKVTVVEASPNLLSGVDPELTKVVQKRLEKLGVTILTNTVTKSLREVSGYVEATLAPTSNSAAKPSESNADKTDGGQKNVYERVLITIGRTPNTDSLGLDRIGLKLDQKGFIPVSPTRQTSIPNIFAIGDVAGQPLLAHKGSKEGLVAAEAIAGLKTVYDVRSMPAVIFTDPEIATVGLTEAEGKAKGFDVSVGTFPFAANGRALSMGEPEGFVKLVGDKNTGRLLGAHMVGPEVSNFVSELALAIEMGAMVEDVALTVHPHPTLSETVMEAAEVLLGHAIHIYKPKTSTQRSAQL